MEHRILFCTVPNFLIGILINIRTRTRTRARARILEEISKKYLIFKLPLVIIQKKLKKEASMLEYFYKAALVFAFAFSLQESSLSAQSSENICIIQVTTSIQDAVDSAHPGCIIKVPAGVYAESVQIPINLTNLTIIAEEGAIIDATNFENGIASSPPFTELPTVYSIPDFPCPGPGIKNLTIEGLTIRNATSNGIFLVGAKNFLIVNCVCENNAEYGIFPQCSKNGIIAYNEVSGSLDAGIYVGVSENVSVQHNIAHDNVIGIEIENSINCDAQANESFNNTIGLLCDIGPNLPIKALSKILLANNDIHDNNVRGINPDVNSPPPAVDVEVTAALTPSGIIILGGGPYVLFGNKVYNHEAFGLIMIDLPLRWWGNADPTDPIQPRDPGLFSQRFPNGIVLSNNSMSNNATLLSIPFDVLLATNNPSPASAICLDQNNNLTSGGDVVPTSALIVNVMPKLPVERDSNLPLSTPIGEIIPSTTPCTIPLWAIERLL